MTSVIIRTFLKTTSGRYIVIGCSIYFFEIAVIIIAQKLGAGPILAVALSFWLGLTVSFILQKFVAFQDKRTSKKILIPQLISVCVLVLFNFGFTLLVTKLLLRLFPAILTRTIALAISTIWNFYLYKTHIFASNNLFPIE
ncbi:hypothetical protein BH10PAT3_BH10PAT3_6600 [soil metagenome]